MRRALGKGLAQLLGEQEEAATQEVAIDAIAPNPRQPRRTFKEEPLAELAASIKQIGILQPIIVRQVHEGRFEIIAGERRWRAARIAGLERVPVVLRSAGEQESLALALIENIQREDISPLECAEAYAQLISDFGLTQEELAQRVGKSRPAVANALRLLKLPPEIREALASEQITEGHARALLQFDTESEQIMAFRRIREKGLSVRESEKLATRRPSTPRAKTTETGLREQNELDSPLSEFFGSPARVVRSGRGGRIEIDFFDNDDLDRIFEKLGIRL